jgi:CubicO group peptidase (beta-lactamase class C family)
MRSIPLILASAAATLWAALACAQTSQLAQGEGVPPTPLSPVKGTSDAPAADVAAAQLTKADVDAWLDGFFPYALHQGDVAGAVVIVVKDGEVLTQRGFGYADVAARKPVDPQYTLFRPGSVSKLFTWTAVMQLVERGKVDLDTDVNEYLDFEIPHYDGKPVTLRNILTHTAGFEEQVKGLMGTPEDGVRDLGEHLKRWVPSIIFEPGTTPAYSNYATALAGYLVQVVSGMPFDDYMDRHIFEPLGMEYSTFRQPLPERLQPHMSKGYPAASLPEKPFEIVGPAPAGSLSTSGADMARFMIAHLQKGRYGEAQILEPETAELMHTSALTLMPHLNRMLLGFYEANYNGRRVIAHAGDTQWFHSDLHLFIDDNVGLFVSLNSTGTGRTAGQLRDELFQQFADRYLPGPTLDGEVDEKTAAEHARMIAGTYLNSRRMETRFLSLLNLGGGVKVIDNGDGTIGLSAVTSPSGVPRKWREIKPFVWRQVDGKVLLEAVVEDGRVQRFSFSSVSPFLVFEPMSPAKSNTWLRPAFVAGLGALALTMLAWPISALTRRHYRVRYVLTGEDAKVHRWIRIAATATVIVWLCWIGLLSSMMSNFGLLSERTDIWLRILQLLGAIVFPAAAAVGLWNAWSVRRSRRSWYAKVWAVLLALGLLVSLWVAVAFHILSFSTNY